LYTYLQPVILKNQRAWVLAALFASRKTVLKSQTIESNSSTLIERGPLYSESLPHSALRSEHPITHIIPARFRLDGILFLNLCFFAFIFAI